MTWAYDTTLATSKDKVRFNIGDTDTDDQKVSDEEISAILASYPNVIKASIVILEGLIMKYAGGGNERVGDVSVDYGSLANTYKERILLLKDRMVSECGTIGAGGISKAEKESQASDTDRVAPKFTKDMNEFVGITPDENGDD